MPQTTLHHGDCLEILTRVSDCSIETIITDPPYGLSQHSQEDILACLRAWLSRERYEHSKAGFMSKDWDKFVPGPEIWRECYRVLKPGGMCFVFAAPRSMDLMGIALRLAGFEIRDAIAWLYSQGMPKGVDISKQIDKQAGATREVVGPKHITYDGCKRDPAKHKDRDDLPGVGEWGLNKSPHGLLETAPATDAAKAWQGYNSGLKPAFEPIIVCMKPMEGNFAQNAVKHGIAGLNIDACRIGTSGGGWNGLTSDRRGSAWDASGFKGVAAPQAEQKGRFPANVILECTCSGPPHAPDCPCGVLDAQSGTLKSGTNCVRRKEGTFIEHGSLGKAGDVQVTYGDEGGASRFFYCAKAAASEKNRGCETLATEDKRPNFHPTVKPLALCQYLCRLTKTPTSGTVLDPFMGSGTTGLACRNEGRDFIGMELNKEYFDIAQARLAMGETKESLKCEEVSNQFSDVEMEL